MTTTSEVARERLVTDFKAVISDTEDLLRATAHETGERVASARERVEERLRTAKVQLAELQDNAVAKAKAAAHATDEYVHEHPWQAIGVGAAVGFLLGLLTCRR